MLVESRPGHVTSHMVLGDPVALCGPLYPLKMRIKNYCPAHLLEMLWSEKARKHTRLLCFKFHPVQIFVIVLSQRACKTFLKKKSLLCFYKLRNLPWLRKLAGKNSHLVLINYRRYRSRMELAPCLYAEFKCYFLACREPFLNYIKWKIWKRIL